MGFRAARPWIVGALFCIGLIVVGAWLASVTHTDTSGCPAPALRIPCDPVLKQQFFLPGLVIVLIGVAGSTVLVVRGLVLLIRAGRRKLSDWEQRAA
jgi:hypothetical protein